MAEPETRGTAELPPVLSYYYRAETGEGGYTLRSATVGDLQSIEGLVITQGSAVVKAEYNPDSPALENLAVETHPQTGDARAHPSGPAKSGGVGG